MIQPTNNSNRAHNEPYHVFTTAPVPGSIQNTPELQAFTTITLTRRSLELATTTLLTLRANRKTCVLGQLPAYIRFDDKDLEGLEQSN